MLARLRSHQYHHWNWPLMQNFPLTLFLTETFDMLCFSPRWVDVVSIVRICMMSNSSGFYLVVLLDDLFWKWQLVMWRGSFRDAFWPHVNLACFVVQCQLIDVIASFTTSLTAQLSNRSSNLCAHSYTSMESSFTLFSIVYGIRSLLAMTKVGLWLTTVVSFK
jgi:hypothetical protein